jgi:hypothetical protein
MLMSLVLYSCDAVRNNVMILSSGVRDGGWDLFLVVGRLNGCKMCGRIEILGFMDMDRLEGCQMAFELFVWRFEGGLHRES